MVNLHKVWIEFQTLSAVCKKNILNKVETTTYKQKVVFPGKVWGWLCIDRKTNPSFLSRPDRKDYPKEEEHLLSCQGRKVCFQI